jgi:hypothetical protein
MVHGAVEYMGGNKWYVSVWNLSNGISDIRYCGIYRMENVLCVIVELITWKVVRGTVEFIEWNK